MANIETIITVFLAILGGAAIIVLLIAIFELLHGRKAQERELRELQEMYRQPVVVDLEIETSAPITLNGQNIDPGKGTISMMIKRPEAGTGVSYETALGMMEGKKREYVLLVERELSALPGGMVSRTGKKVVATQKGLNIASISIHNGVGKVYVYDYSEGGGQGRFISFTLVSQNEVNRAIAAIRSADNHARASRN